MNYFPARWPHTLFVPYMLTIASDPLSDNATFDDKITLCWYISLEYLEHCSCHPRRDAHPVCFPRRSSDCHYAVSTYGKFRNECPRVAGDKQTMRIRKSVLKTVMLSFTCAIASTVVCLVDVFWFSLYYNKMSHSI